MSSKWPASRPMDSPPDGENAPLLQGTGSGTVLDQNVQTTYSETKKHGLTILTAGVFIIGDMAGSGVLSLPSAVVDTGWIGLVLIIACAIVSAYTGILLGTCWLILQERYPDKYKDKHTRYPYPAIGYETFGYSGKYSVSFCVNFTLFGVSTVFLIIASNNLQNLVETFSHQHDHLSSCWWLVIVGCCMCPLTWLGTPKDFWPIAVLASSATAVACLLLFIGTLLDAPDHQVDQKTVTFNNFFIAFGTILFAFGGHAVFPTIQVDMRDSNKFPRAVQWSYAAILLMYFPVASSGYFVYGLKTGSDISKMLGNDGIRSTVEILITLHLIMAFVFVINPFCQEMEEFLKIPLNFNWKRCCLRSIVVACVIFVGETIPSFGSILSLVGGSTVTFLTFVFPSVFYLKLCYRRSVNWPDRPMPPLYGQIMHGEIITIGLIGAVASTYAAVNSIISSHFAKPCYV